MNFRLAATLFAPILACSVATAASADITDTPEVACAEYGVIAAQVMRARQREEPLSEVLASLSAANALDANGTVRGITIGAYEVPSMSDPDYQDRMVKRYRNMVETACFRNLTK